MNHELYEWLPNAKVEPSHIVQLSIYATTKDPYTLKHKLSIQIHENVEEMPLLDENIEQAALAEIAMIYYNSLCITKPEIAKNIVGIRIIRTPFFTDNTKKHPPDTSIEVKIGEGRTLKLEDLLNADLVIK